MNKLSGYEEKKAQIREKINAELSTLPEIFKKYIEHLWDDGKADTTVYSYLKTLTTSIRSILQIYYFSNEDFYQSISESNITNYFKTKEDLGVQALQRHWSSLNSFFSFLLENNYISSNPMQSIKRPIGSSTERKLNYLTKKDLDRLIFSIKHNPTKFTAFRDEVIIKLAIATGIDLIDMVNLNYEHIDFDCNTIHIFNKKGERILSLSPMMTSLLKDWICFRNNYFKGSDTPALFVSSLKNRLSINTVGQIIQKHCEEANVPIITFKDLKSTMVYLLAQENVSMESIMEFLGTSDYLSIAQAYDAALKEKNINIINAIDGLFEQPLPNTSAPIKTISLFEQPFSNTSEPSNISPTKRSIAIEIKSPEYASFTGGGKGFIIYGNITNLTGNPMKVKLKSCALFIDGMLRSSDYVYTGYAFEEEILFPNTIRTFGKIWITDDLFTKKIQPGDYLILTLTETDSQINYHIKYTYNENRIGCFWAEENWYEMS